MNIPHKELCVDINRKNHLTVDLIGHVNDNSTRYIDLKLINDYEVIELDENSCTATVTYTSDGVLLEEDVECDIENNAIIIGFDSGTIENARSGILAIQPKVTDDNDNNVFVLQIPIEVRVSPDLAQISRVDDNSHGSYAEVVQEIAAARGNYQNLSERLANTAAPTDEQVDEAVADYLDEHPNVESVINKKNVINNQSQEGDDDTNYPTVGAVRDFVNYVKGELEDYVEDYVDETIGGIENGSY